MALNYNLVKVTTVFANGLIDCRLWESLKSPDAVQDVVDTATIPVLMNDGEFVLTFAQRPRAAHG
jgi:hypothetical protein